MSQHDMVIENQGFAATRADINAALAALATNSSGATEPATTYAYQWWADTTAGILKQRNAANNAWIDILNLSTGLPFQAASQAEMEAGTETALRAMSPLRVAQAIDALSSGGGGVQGAFKNLQASATGTSASISISADEIVVENASNAYQTLRSVSLTIAGTSVGANALDAGTIATSTWYSVWVIWNGTTTAGLLSLSATAPTLPSGYTHFARVGWIRTDGSGNKYPLSFKQYGHDVQYVLAAGSNLTGYPTMASGAAGNASTPTYIAVGISSFVPPTASAISISLKNTNGATASGCAPNASHGRFDSNTNPPPMLAYSSGVPVIFSQLLIESTNVYWFADSASYLFAIGWRDNL